MVELDLITFQSWSNLAKGIDRIPDEERSPPSIWNIFFLWFSMTCHVGTIPLGMLGAEFGLSLGQSVAAIVVGLGLGILCPAFTGQLGPKVGLHYRVCFIWFTAADDEYSLVFDRLLAPGIGKYLSSDSHIDSLLTAQQASDSGVRSYVVS